MLTGYRRYGAGQINMDGYDEQTYGNAFADVYDDWYGDVSNIDATVATLLELAAGGRVLELGVGTGRLAVPLAAAGQNAGLRVTGIDSSAAMLAQLAERDSSHIVEVIEGNMVTDLPDGPFDTIFVAYNTLFNIRTADEQQACLVAVAERLAPTGSFVVEAFVPDEHAAATSAVTVKSLDVDRVVLSVSRQDPDNQTADGQFVEFTEHGGVRLRPWSIRYQSPAQLDTSAAKAGLVLVDRWASFDRSAFEPDGDRHVSVYRRR